MTARVSVVIPCLNEEKYIRTCVESILSNGYPINLLEVLVADGRSTDQTRSIISELSTKHPNVRLLDNKERTTPQAMNLGIREAKGDFVMIAGAHSSYDHGYIGACVAAMSTLDADVVGGMLRTEVLNETNTSLAIRAVLSHPVGVGNSMFRIGVAEPQRVDTVPFGLYKRKMLVDLGGFNLQLRRNQDMEMSKRLAAHGARIWLIPTVQAIYYARENWSSFYQNNFLNGLWNIRTIRITGRLKSIGLRHITPIIFLMSLVLPTALAFWYPPLVFVSLLSLLTYLLVILYFSFRIDSKAAPFHVFWTFIVLHFSYAFGLTKGVLTFHKKI